MTAKVMNGHELVLARLGIRVADDEGGERVDEVTTSYEGFRKSVLRNTEWSGTKYRDILKAITGPLPAGQIAIFPAGLTGPMSPSPSGPSCKSSSRYPKMLMVLNVRNFRRKPQ